MKNEKYHTVGTVPKCKRNIVGTETKSIHPTHMYMTAQLPDLVHTQQVVGLNLSYVPSQ